MISFETSFFEALDWGVLKRCVWSVCVCVQVSVCSCVLEKIGVRFMWRRDPGNTRQENC